MKNKMKYRTEEEYKKMYDVRTKSFVCENDPFPLTYEEHKNQIDAMDSMMTGPYTIIYDMWDTKLKKEVYYSQEEHQQFDDLNIPEHIIPYSQRNEKNPSGRTFNLCGF